MAAARPLPRSEPANSLALQPRDRSPINPRMGAIRLFLALAVLQSHIYGHFLRPAQIYVNNTIVFGVNGGYAVAFFFVISGFLISFVLEGKYDRPGGAVEFYRARSLRIYPLWWSLYLLVPCVSGGLWAFVASRHAYDLLTGFFIYGSDWLLSFRAYPNQYSDPMPHGLELGWTLATEITFYLFAPFILRSRLWPAAIFIASVLLRMWLNIRFPPEAAFGIWNNWCYYFFPALVFFFMLGHLTRQLYKVIRVPVWAGWTGLGLAVFICWLQDASYAYDNVDFYTAILIFTIVLPAIFDASKDNRVCNFLGDLTYPLYLSQGTLLVLLDTGGPLNGIMEHLLASSRLIPSFHPFELTARALVVSVPIWVIALLFATAVHFAIEKPATAALRAAFRGYDALRRPSAAAGVPQ